MPPSELQRLLRVLEERDIPLTRDDVAWAFQNTDTRDAATQWVREYLSPETLLTKDEVKYCEREGDIAPSDLNPAHGRPMSDLEIEAAIASLESSTAAIERQCQVMATQKQALQTLQRRNASNDRAVTGANTRQQRFSRERAQLDFDVEELSQTVSSRLRASSKLADAATTSIPTHIERLLTKDDRLFDGLQKLIPRLSESSNHLDEAAEVDRLCHTLASLSVHEIRARLDLTYRAALAEQSYQRNGSHGKALSSQQAKQQDTLRSELGELGGEIEGLVGMVIDQHHRKPLNQSRRSALEDLQAQKAKWTEYTTSVMMYLAARLDALCDHVQHLHAHRGTLQTVFTSLDDTVSERQNKPGAPPSSPHVERTASRGLKPLRLVQANLSEPQDPGIQLLRQLDIRILDSDSTAKIAETLDAALRERTSKLSSLSHTTEDAFTDALVASLAKPQSDVQSLLYAVHAHSKFHTVELVDRDVRHGTLALESETQRLGEEMRELNMDDIARSVKAKQAEIVQKLTG